MEWEKMPFKCERMLVKYLKSRFYLIKIVYITHEKQRIIKTCMHSQKIHTHQTESNYFRDQE